MRGGRPVPLHGQASEVLVDFGIWREQAMRDNRIDEREAVAAMPILLSLVAAASPMVATIEHVTSCLAGSRGMDSPRVIRGWNERRKRKTGENVVPFERRHDDGDEAA